MIPRAKVTCNRWWMSTNSCSVIYICTCNGLIFTYVAQSYFYLSKFIKYTYWRNRGWAVGDVEAHARRKHFLLPTRRLWVRYHGGSSSEPGQIRCLPTSTKTNTLIGFDRSRDQYHHESTVSEGLFSYLIGEKAALSSSAGGAAKRSRNPGNRTSNTNVKLIRINKSKTDS